MPRRYILLISWLAVAQAPDAAQADEPETLPPQTRPMDPAARTRLEQGLVHYNAREYELAITAFAAGYAIDPRRDFLFAMAQAERLSGDCPTAVVLYEKFLASQPPAAQERAARDNLGRCRTALTSRPEEAEPVATAAVPAALPAATRHLAPAAILAPAVPRDRGSPPWYHDELGVTLLGASVASLGVGAGYLVASRSAESAAQDAATYGESMALFERAEHRRTVAWIGFGAGAALLTSAAVRYLWFPAEPSSRRRALAASVTSTHAGLALSVTF
jgi:hypothetical protein